MNALPSSELLTALQPAPSSVPPEGPPPWPPPIRREELKTPEAYPRTHGNVVIIFGALVIGAMGFQADSLTWRVILCGACGLSALGAFVAALKSFPQERQERDAWFAAYADHMRRAVTTWARVSQASIVGEVRGKRGVLLKYVLNVTLVPWHGGRGLGWTEPVRLQVTLSSTTAPHVVPGAYFGVVSDPEKPWVVPQCVLTLQGAQLPL